MLISVSLIKQEGHAHSFLISSASESITSFEIFDVSRLWATFDGHIHTLTTIISSDLKSDGFALGSSIIAEDWNDWKSPVISRDSAKLFRKRT